MTDHESEWLTRKKRIDTRLRSLGWKIVPFEAGRAVAERRHRRLTLECGDSSPL